MANEPQANTPSDARQPADPSAVPADLKVQLKAQKLTILWKDGRTSEYSLDQLRKSCPCATCRTEREKTEQNPLQILKFDPTGVKVVSANLVGTYAIQFHWSDGHNTGIFDFRYIKSLDENAPPAGH